MPTVENLLLEKRRYGLKQTVSSFEKKLLKKGMPVQKIIGYIEMAGVLIDLSFDVLIPRYETEELIYLVFDAYTKDAKLKILDLCCGSGFIGLALKKHFFNSCLDLSDISLHSVLQSKLNAKNNKLNVNVIQSDLFENINNKYDIIVCNPPYISFNEQLDHSVLDFEPHLALFANDDGLYFYKQILKQAPTYLKNTAKVFFEINPLHLNWWKEQKKFYDLEILNDLSNRARFVIWHYKK
ncbi:release factor glutamine methyltransferase [Mycoplasmopsis mustelae]|uniref:peptide chain release factor N(5)-glutamine methyltransferase n=1 Tax=Mycoplasmopsis mustelae TaxID=171289 RepID=A0A4R7UCK8_9BACT|nr:peptide chain release factor N(5)-glutamine methyltransferase [Mycoplasmopsis mustelae]TDV24182.1 release factor glutamine methyltransferase [Mycoplasmopsis mustelae]